MPTPLQAVRHHLDYTAAQVIDLLTRRATALNQPIASKTSLKTKLSRWENDKEQPSAGYQRLFREIYGRTNTELGFPDEPEEDPEAAELRSRLAVARTIDTHTVTLFRQQVDHARTIDRRFGGLTQLDQLRAQISQVHQLLAYSIGGARSALTEELMEASTLAGWQALDRAALGQAWTHYERAKTASLESTSPTLLAHVLAEQAFLLIDLDETTTTAADQLAHARHLATGTAPALLRAWLAAAHGEALAAGHTNDAHRAFDTADALLPTNPIDPELPFLFLGGAHLDRWRGHALARLGAPDAIDHLTNALTRLPRTSSAPACTSTWPTPTPTPPPTTETPPSPTPATPAASPHRSSPTGNYDGSTGSSCPAALPRDAR